MKWLAIFLALACCEAETESSCPAPETTPTTEGDDVPKEIKISPKGLYTNPNLLSVPDGALATATNIVIRRDGIIEQRRGQSTYGDLSSIMTTGYGLLVYDGTLMAIGLDASTGYGLYYDNGSGTFARGANGMSTPQSTNRFRTTEAKDNLYVATGSGVIFVDSPTSTAPLLANIGFAPGFYRSQVSGSESPQLTGTGGFLTDGNQCAYRAVLNFPDANNNEKLSAVSSRLVVANASGTHGYSAATDRNVVLKVFLYQPSSWSFGTVLSTDVSIRLYRSKQASTSIEPSEEMGLVYETRLTATDISNKYITITDIVPDALTGETLYTSPSQEGIEQNNEMPPFAKDVLWFNDAMWYANTQGRFQGVVNLLAVGGSDGIQNNEIISLGGATYTAVTGTPTTSQFKIETGGTTSQNIRNTAMNLVSVINTGTSSHGITAHYISGPDDPPGRIYIEKRILGIVPGNLGIEGNYASSKRGAWAPKLSPYRISSVSTWDLARIASTVTATESTAATHNVEVGDEVVLFNGNADFPNGTKTVTAVTGTTFSYTESGAPTSLAGRTFTMLNPTTATRETNINRVYRSKSGQPEAVPLLNYDDLGTSASDVLRLAKTRESIFAFTDDGLYVNGSGEVGGWRLLDPTVILTAPESVASLGNQLFALTRQGVVSITNTGVEIISRPIENLISGIASSDPIGLGYESESTYELRTSSAGYLYNTLTQSWTYDDMPGYAGVISPVDNKRYLLGGTSGRYVRQERKAGTYADYSDPDVSVTVNSVSGTSVTLASASGVSVGDVLTQSTYKSRITAINGNVVTTESTPGFTAAAATVKTRIQSIVQWAPITGGDSSALKLFSETTLLFGDAHLAEATATYSTELIRSTTDVTIDGVTTIGQWVNAGTTWDGTERPFNLVIVPPQEYRRAALLNFKFTNANAWSHYLINGLVVKFSVSGGRVAR